MEEYNLLIGETDYSSINNKEYTIIDFNNFNTFQIFFKKDSILFKGISLYDKEFIFKITYYNIFYRSFSNLLNNDDSITFKSNDSYITIYKNDSDIFINIKDNHKKYIEDNIISLDYNYILLKLFNDISNTFNIYENIDKKIINYIDTEIANKLSIEKMRDISYVLRTMIDICIENNLKNIDYNIIYILAFYNEIYFDKYNDLFLSKLGEKQHIFINDVLLNKITPDTNIYSYLLNNANREVNSKRQILSLNNYQLPHFNDDSGVEHYSKEDSNILGNAYLVLK